APDSCAFSARIRAWMYWSATRFFCGPGRLAGATFSKSERVITVLQSEGVVAFPLGFSQRPWIVMTGVSGAGVALSGVACFSAGEVSARGFNVGEVEVDWPTAATASSRQATR